MGDDPPYKRRDVWGLEVVETSMEMIKTREV